MQVSESLAKKIKNKSAFDVEYQFYPSYLMVQEVQAEIYPTSIYTYKQYIDSVNRTV